MPTQNTGRIPASYPENDIKKEVIGASEDTDTNTFSKTYKGAMFLIWFILCFLCTVITVGILLATREGAPLGGLTISPSLTASPTELPTTFPSASNGTKLPTKLPLNNPSALPTLNPIESPTKYPTENLSSLSTRNPTESPTKLPTERPSPLPTLNPIGSPTKLPTESPSPLPPRNPTKSPTRIPTNSPSHLPTRNPTKSPTRIPTNSPPHLPTRNPTEFTTKLPTESPSPLPTLHPTKSPTKRPTNSPGFCGDLGLNDGLIRERLYNDFRKEPLEVPMGDYRVSYINKGQDSLKCLPENAFGLLSASDFHLVVKLQISESIEKIHPEAFHLDYVAGINELDLSDNKIMDLAANVFENFQLLRSFRIGSNPFVRLEHNIFGAIKIVEYIYMNDCINLVEFPAWLEKQIYLKDLYFLGDNNINSIKNGHVFYDLLYLQGIEFTEGKTPILNELGQLTLAGRLNLNPNMIVVRKP